MQGLPLFAARRRNIFLYVVAVAVPVVFLLTMLSQRVFAQNTYVITDGDQVIVHTTNASDPAMALDEAGVVADPDEYSTTQTEAGVYDITVRRNDTVTVQYGSNVITVPLQDETVGALLNRLGYSAEAGYLTSSDLDAALQGGMTITVEPGIYIEGKLGVRIEDCCVVTETGKIDLVSSTKELLSVD